MKIYQLIILLYLLTHFNMGICQSVDGGNGHSLILDESGVVWTIGRNNHGQLGDGSFNNSAIPIPLIDLPPIASISRGYDHSMAIDSFGNIWSWGLNNYGQLGTKSNTTSNIPTILEGHSNFVCVEGGHWHTVALKEDGSVWSWGHNYYGELGHKNLEHSETPKSVLTKTDSSEVLTPLTGISDIKSVGYHTLALDSNGTVWGWGSNSFYQLLPKKCDVVYTATQISDLPKIQSIGTGWHHSIALDTSGNIWAWGSDPSGQYQESTTKFFEKPIKFDDLPIIKNSMWKLAFTSH